MSVKTKPSTHVQAILRISKATKCDYAQWRELLDGLCIFELAEIYFLLEHLGGNLSDAIHRWSNREVCVFPGNEADAAQELFCALYIHEIPEYLQCYVDYESFGRDLRLGGDLRVFEFCGETYCCTNCNSV